MVVVLCYFSYLLERKILMFHVWRPSWVMSLISCVSASPGPLKVMVMMAPDGKGWSLIIIHFLSCNSVVRTEF